MHKKFNASLLGFVIVLSAFFLSGRQSEQTALAAPLASHDLLSALPASDFIIYVDAQRVLTDVIPGILIDQPMVLASIESDLDKFKSEVGFDPRLLDAIAVGLKFDSDKSHDPNFALLARGRFDATAVIDSGLTSASRRSRGVLEKQTQQYEGKTIYMLGPATRPETERETTPDDQIEPSANTIVFVALDSNTVAFGNLKNVRATIDAAMGRDRVDSELVELASRTSNAVASFSGKVTPELAGSFRLHITQVDNSVASVKQIYGSFSSTGSDGEALVNIRTDDEEQARKLGMALNALKFMARIGGSRASGENKSVETMIQNVNVYAVGNEVLITLKFSQTDLAPFLHMH